jgi:hypothetical protein
LRLPTGVPKFGEAMAKRNQPSSPGPKYLGHVVGEISGFQPARAMVGLSRSQSPDATSTAWVSSSPPVTTELSRSAMALPSFGRRG